MQLAKDASQCAFTLETTTGRPDTPCVQGMRYCSDRMDRVGEGTETDTLVTCHDLHLSHTFKPRCVVHAADRQQRSCASFGTGPACRQHYEPAGPCVWREAAKSCEPDRLCELVMMPLPPHPPPPPPSAPSPPPRPPSPPPIDWGMSPPPPRQCLGSPHGAEDDGGLEDCERRFCDAEIESSLEDACTWCRCASCSQCPARAGGLPPSPPHPPFAEATDLYMYRGKRVVFMGANMWYAMHLACDNCASGSRERLVHELDQLASMGVKTVTVLASSEGGDIGLGQWSIQPALQPSPGEYNHHLLDGLDFVMHELELRGMAAIMVLNNAWPWSGGMGQYLEWAEEEPMPLPTKSKQSYNEESWQDIGYFKRVCDFFDNGRAIEMSHNHIKFLLRRTNSFSGRVYGNDPNIMAWQLAHQPRPIDKGTRDSYLEWIRDTSALIKTLAPHHMVTVGSEGAHSSRAEEAATIKAETWNKWNKDYKWSPWVVDTFDFEQEHADKNVDFATVQVWPSQWGWLCTKHDYGSTRCQAKADEQTWLERVRQYLDAHIDAAERLGKPIVIQEVGMARDGNSYTEGSKTRDRNALLSATFAIAHESMSQSGAVAGVFFSGWAGEGRKKHGIWEDGDPIVAEPPHEYQARKLCARNPWRSIAMPPLRLACPMCAQGRNSIYNTDVSTVQIVSSYAQRFEHIMDDFQTGRRS